MPGVTPSVAAAAAGRADLRRAAAERRVALRPLRRRIADAEAAVVRLNAEIAQIDALLAGSGLFARDPAKAATLAKARADHVRRARQGGGGLAGSERARGNRDQGLMIRGRDARMASDDVQPPCVPSGAGGFFRSCLLRLGGCRRWARRSLDRDQSAADKAVNPAEGPRRYVKTTARSPRSSALTSIFSTAPARRTTSHSVICNAIPPAPGPLPADDGSAKPAACSVAAAHAPSALTRSAGVTGRGENRSCPVKSPPSPASASWSRAWAPA